MIKAIKPGLHRSDKNGHLLLFDNDGPLSVMTCAICNETAPATPAAASEFTAKHGYLGEWLAPNFQDYLYQKLGLSDWKLKEIVLSDSNIRWNIVHSGGIV
jgi:hypothetical protein